MHHLITHTLPLPLPLMSVFDRGLRERAQLLKASRNEDGYTIETVIIVAGIAVVAIGVIALLSALILAKAGSINLG